MRLLSTASTKCCSQSNLRRITSGITGLLKVTESKPSSFPSTGFFRIISNAVSSLVSFFLRLCSEVPLLEDTLMRILVIGLSRDLPLGPADAMELADHLVKRAAGVQSDGSAYPVIHSSIFHSSDFEWSLAGSVCVCFVDLDVLHVERIQLIDAVLNLCTYHHPENIQLPAG